MIRALGKGFSKVASKLLPDAFIFAVILCLLVLILGWTVEGENPLIMSTYFGEGMWAFLKFSMQMTLIIVTGSALANSGPVKSLLKSIAGLAKTSGQAIVLVTFFTSIACWLNWGFGLIIGALLAREFARRIPSVHYPLLVSSAYSGFLVWHAGFSASIPLKLTGEDAIMQKFADGTIIPVSETIFSTANIILFLVILLTLPLINYLMHPKEKDILLVNPSLFTDDDEQSPKKSRKDMSPAEKLENSILISVLISTISSIYLVMYFLGGGSISLNIVIFIFLTAGIMLHRYPISYVKAVTEAVKGTAGVVLQFPFYAGIMGMMINSGLAETFSKGFISISNAGTFPFFSFISAGFVNIFVPSGGGQWGVQGPIMIPAAKALGVSYSVTAMSIAWGDAWTNMIQPFWALPLLGVAKLNIRDIMGYNVVNLLYSGIVISLFMLFVF